MLQLQHAEWATTTDRSHRQSTWRIELLSLPELRVSTINNGWGGRQVRLKVVTFNLQYGQCWDDADPDHAPIDLDQSVNLLLNQEADLIFLQEVERVDRQLGPLTPPPNFTHLKERLIGYHGAFCYPPEDRDELPFGYGLAIFSKTELYAIEAIPLPAPALEFEFEGRRMRPTQRVMLAARTRISGREVQLFNVHLQSFFIIGKSSDDYPQQRNTVVERLKEAIGPTLLCGDFNSAPDEGTIEEMARAGVTTIQARERTWRRMPYVLDHIMHSKHFEPNDFYVQLTDCSDHMLLAGNLTLPDQQEP